MRKPEPETAQLHDCRRSTRPDSVLGALARGDRGGDRVGAQRRIVSDRSSSARAGRVADAQNVDGSRPRQQDRRHRSSDAGCGRSAAVARRPPRLELSSRPRPTPLGHHQPEPDETARTRETRNSKSKRPRPWIVLGSRSVGGPRTGEVGAPWRHPNRTCAPSTDAVASTRPTVSRTREPFVCVRRTERRSRTQIDSKGGGHVKADGCPGAGDDCREQHARLGGRRGVTQSWGTDGEHSSGGRRWRGVRIRSRSAPLRYEHQPLSEVSGR
jgi:hypothetical protein